MPIYRSDQAQMTFAVEAAPGGYPELATTATDTTVGVPGALTAAAPASATNGVDIGTHLYKYTWIIGGVESAGGATSAVVTIANAANQSVTLAGIVTDGGGTATKHVYRTKANQTTPFWRVTNAGAIAANTNGYPDIIQDSALTVLMPSTGLMNMADDAPAGSRSITVDTYLTGAFVVGNFIRIGPMWGSGVPLIQETEIRRIEFIEGHNLHLDTPTAFFHPDNTSVQIVTNVTDTDADKYMTTVPGVYETVEVPDPEMAIEPRYFLGTASKRNFYSAYKGQQTFTGSLGGFVLLDGKALRFPIGKVVTTPVAAAFEASTTILAAGATKKGDVYVAIDGESVGSLSPGDWLNFDKGSATLSEVRKVLARSNPSSATTTVTLDAPLQFDHADNSIMGRIRPSTAGVYYTHNIIETVELDSMSWHVHVRDSSETDANDFDRRYHGGKVGSMSLTAEEGGLLTCSWDGVNFLGMNHNQKLTTDHAATPANVNVPFYTLMQPIRNANVTLPTTEPYYFSQGQVTLFGSVVARVRSFTLSVNNNEEPRYYLKRTMGRHRGPSEIMEQRREYTCSITMALPDAGASLTSTSANSIFKDLLLEGDFGSGMQGFAIELRFDRGTNDNIVITIPDDGVAGTGGNNQGAFINTAPHAITDANPMEVDASVIFRNMKIEIQDSVPVYV